MRQKQEAGLHDNPIAWHTRESHLTMCAPLTIWFMVLRAWEWLMIREKRKKTFDISCGSRRQLWTSLVRKKKGVLRICVYAKRVRQTVWSQSLICADIFLFTPNHVWTECSSRAERCHRFRQYDECDQVSIGSNAPSRPAPSSGNELISCSAV